MILSNPLAGIAISIGAYAIGMLIKNKTGSSIVNPQVIAAVLIIALILMGLIPLEGYQTGGQMITMFIVPATTVLALQIHRQWRLLRQHLLPVLCGCLAGSVTSIAVVRGLCAVFSIEDALTASLQPKSVTTAIALELSEAHGGIAAIAVFAVVLTGIASAVLSPLMIRIMRLRNPIATGVAIGASGHAIGTSKALEYGEIEGAMSGIAMAMSGILTSILYLFF